MQTLCMNCENNSSCLWQNDHIILCNEHLTPPLAKRASNTHSTLIKGTTSLCTTCDHKHACVFNQPGL